MRSLSLALFTFSLLFLYVLATPTTHPYSPLANRGVAKRHSHIRRSLIQNSTGASSDVEAQAPSGRRTRRQSKQCKPRPNSAVPSATAAPKPQNGAAQPKPTKKADPTTSAKPKPTSQPAPPPVKGGNKMDMIKSLYAFSGFVYAISSCPSSDKMVSDFKSMASKGARVAITFDRCGNGNSGFYSSLISAAGKANLKVIPLIFTINSNIDAEMGAVISAVKGNPDPVLAVSFGDEPLFSGISASDITSKIRYIRSQFNNAGLSIPLSISELAFGWQQAGDISTLANTLDFFMINNFPYFAGNVGSPGADSTFNLFKNDISYYQSIAKGKPLLVTQTGWASNQNIFPPTNRGIDTSVSGEQSYYGMLDSHCDDFFKAKNIGWLWRDWDDTLSGWGVKDASGNFKFTANARASC